MRSALCRVRSCCRADHHHPRFAAKGVARGLRTSQGAWEGRLRQGHAGAQEGDDRHLCDEGAQEGGRHPAQPGGPHEDGDAHPEADPASVPHAHVFWCVAAAPPPPCQPGKARAARTCESGAMGGVVCTRGGPQPALTARRSVPPRALQLSRARASCTWCSTTSPAASSSTGSSARAASRPSASSCTQQRSL